MNEFNWEFFEDGPPSATASSVHVTINTRCMIFFNRQAHAALGSPEGVSLMYDPRRSTIGVIPTPLNRRSTYKLRAKDGRRMASGCMISAKNFCKRFEILPQESLAFTDAEINNDGILILDLNKVRSVEKRR